MIVPNAENIKQAIADLASPTKFTGSELWVLPAQEKELLSVIPNATNQQIDAYALGCQAMRVVVEGLPGAIINKISI